ncbi:PEP-CTERM sorting domain-containing protein [Parasphingorhabdus halotolerans]|uniref:PEP-CTERM sorting domain-containing protein n=1 Tax=Parasphingorhabdus halotolerans TaxID=2725558 RepID=A0A6H2DNY4_9SPHN|nr:PEP-CTERM sorting domain-containing protein [Parasphingorhabdus halotolerans]QJB69847.1 PEP-CTERM sorting domain-containing protein [Parasphingorhabdus halotolerans]
MLKIAASAALGLLTFTSAASAALIDPQFQRLELTYSGIITNPAAEQIELRDYDGFPAQTYTGPAPDYPYKIGDPFKYSVQVEVPTAAFIDFIKDRTGSILTDADGNYRFTGTDNLSGTLPTGKTSGLDITGSITPGYLNSPGDGNRIKGIDIVFNPAANSYKLALDENGWGRTLLVGPQFIFDEATGTITGGENCFPAPSQFDCTHSYTSFSGTATSLILDRIAVTDSRDGRIWRGLADGFEVTGGWNLPLFGADPTEVPAPPALLLFGMGAGTLAWRRRKQRAN